MPKEHPLNKAMEPVSDGAGELALDMKGAYPLCFAVNPVFGVWKEMALFSLGSTRLCNNLIGGGRDRKGSYHSTGFRAVRSEVLFLFFQDFWF